MRRHVQKIVEEQGWTEHTLCELALNFIESVGDAADFVGYLAEEQRRENSGE